jgi:hypothetical protein
MQSLSRFSLERTLHKVWNVHLFNKEENQFLLMK